MRKLAVALLALPVLLEIYPAAVLRRWRVLRTGTALGLGAVVALTAIGLARPSPTTASLPSPIVPVTQAAFWTVVETDVELDAPATMVFSTPMVPASVAAAILVGPLTEIDLTWDATGTRLTIRPGTRWAAARYHTITVGSGALARTGRPLTTPVRASFLTRGLAVATLGATRAIGSQVALDTALIVRFDRPVDPASLQRALRSTPVVEGTVTAVPGLASGPAFVFTPSRPLRADTTYRFVLDGVRDDDGLLLAPITLTVRTIRAPTVVRFRPVDGTKGVARDAAVSVRFTERMDRASTKRAFSVAVDGAVMEGAIRFDEGDTVLVFTPTSRLRASGKVVAQVGTEARSAAGAPLAAVARASFTTAAAPRPVAPRPAAPPRPVAPRPAAPRPTPTPKPKASPTPVAPSPGSTGGSATGSGAWSPVERYYLGLMNCTRTGGLVTATGACSSPGGRDVAPLKLSSGISTKVSRPYAKLLATRGECSHFIGGNPGDRLRRAGYTNYTWAENLGCRSGDPRDAVLASHRFFQSERSWSPLGGHYVNLMNRKYDRVGIGVWVSHGRVRLVVDFYHP